MSGYASYTITCDAGDCAESVRFVTSRSRVARERAAVEGWRRVKGRDICPRCSR